MLREDERISTFVLAFWQVVAIDCNEEEVFLYLKSLFCPGEKKDRITKTKKVLPP